MVLRLFLYCQIEPLQKEAGIINDMYDLIDLFSVPTPPEDFAVYQVWDFIF